MRPFWRPHESIQLCQQQHLASQAQDRGDHGAVEHGASQQNTPATSTTADAQSAANRLANTICATHPCSNSLSGGIVMTGNTQAMTAAAVIGAIPGPWKRIRCSNSLSAAPQLAELMAMQMDPHVAEQALMADAHAAAMRGSPFFKHWLQVGQFPMAIPIVMAEKPNGGGVGLAVFS